MSKGYWVARVDVTDPEKYKTYITANTNTIAVISLLIRYEIS